MTSPGWIFIIGCYNSGTTLLDRILRQHPDIAALPDEGQFLTSALVTPRSLGIPRLWVEKETSFRFEATAMSEKAEQVKRDWQRQLNKVNYLFALEKSPTNTARTLWLQTHFPPAYFIHIVRNGYAVALGIQSKLLAQGYEGNDLLERAAQQWARSLEVVSEDAVKLQRFLEIRYEDLTECPDRVVSTILQFLELAPFSPEVLSQQYVIHGNQGPIVNQNAKRLAGLTVEQVEVIERRAKSWLLFYGYSPSTVGQLQAIF